MSREEEIVKEISEIEDTLSGNMFEDFSKQDRISLLKRELNLIAQPEVSCSIDDEECLSCGS